MADDVLELTRKCAEEMGYSVRSPIANGPGVWATSIDILGEISYEPHDDSAQAFELLCWLAERGVVYVGLKRCEFDDGKISCASECTNPAELRLALMRAVVKAKESQDGR